MKHICLFRFDISQKKEGQSDKRGTCKKSSETPVSPNVWVQKVGRIKAHYSAWVVVKLYCVETRTFFIPYTVDLRKKDKCFRKRLKETMTKKMYIAFQDLDVHERRKTCLPKGRKEEKEMGRMPFGIFFFS